MSKYDHKAIEAKWRKRWEHEKLGIAKDASSSPKSYVLVEFPYPSGDGLHVGHVRSYTALDAVVRKLRMQGKNVLFPIGWDAFGLPTENYALKTGVHPREATDKNIANFRRQMKSLGLSFDWSREVDTTDPAYYKWTQWIFLKLLKAGLAYQATIPISWCPKDMIGLANEEVVGGKCERCGTTVERRMQKQWMLKITAYADRLLKDLDTVDYSERIKTQQQNWIGRSEGAEVRFEIHKTEKPVALIIHGSPQEPNYSLQMARHFYPWLQRELHTLGYEVIASDLPRANAPDYEIWKQAVKKALGKSKLDHSSLVIGVSAGGSFVARYLAEQKESVANIILIAPACIARIDDTERDNALQKLYTFTFVPGIAKNITVVYSTDDDERYITSAKKFIKGLHAQSIVLPGRGHFTQHDGVRDIPELLDLINKQRSIQVFTTRADTLFGATYLVLSPEHPLVDEITTAKQKKAVEKYKKDVAKKSELERTVLEKEKTGVFTGAFAVNPVNNEKIPVWIADYVLISYGTGAIMAVPAHDERDFEFATKFKLPIREVIVPEFEDEGSKRQAGKPTVIRKTVYALLRNPKNDTYLCLNWNDYYWNTLIIGGVDGDDPVEAAKKEIAEETGFTNVRYVRSLGRQIGHYYAAHKEENRVADAVGLLFDLLDEERTEVKQEELKKHTPKWLTRDEVGAFLNISSQRYVWERYCAGTGAYIGEGRMIDSGQFDGMKSKEGGKKIVAMLEKEGKAKPAVNYKLRDWVFSRQHYWGEPIPVVHCEHCKAEAESTKWKLNFYEGPWRALQSGEKTVETRALNPDEKDRYFVDIKVGDIIKGSLKGMDETMYLRVTERYLLKDLKELYGRKDLLGQLRRNFSPTLDELRRFYSLTPDYLERIEKNGLVAWKVEHVMPGVVPISEKDLPVELPQVKKYQPSGTGKSPLDGIKEWVNVKCPHCGGPARRETDTMPNWAGSSWYFLRYCDPKNDKELASMKKLKYWMPVDLYNGGMEHTTLHLLYSRFWHKFLFDEKLVPTPEPYQRRVSHGMVLASDGRKMSKSFGNVINPDELIEQYGADSVRLYEMFMGPFEDAIPWDPKGIVGMRRFLQRVWDAREKVVENKTILLSELEGAGTAHEVSKGINEMRFNTCISDLMKWVNRWNNEKTINRREYGIFLKVLSPFAPYIAEELWNQLGNGHLLLHESWPRTERWMKKDVTIAIQVNGKLRGTLTVSSGSEQEIVASKAMELDNVKKFMAGDPKKVIFVKDRLINFVV
ncbi:MAG: class I tRNA ligase family protein [Candidatus Kerfeldbacteria bacterium]